MIFENVSFYFKEAILSFRRSTLMSIAAIISTTTILVIVGMFLSILINSNHILETLEAQIEIIAYLKDNISKSEISSLENSLKKIEGVKETKFVSKEEAFQRLSKDLGEQRIILEAIETNPLPASFEITVRDSQTIKHVANQIAKFEKSQILNALIQNDWIQIKAAKLLGIHESVLRYRMKKLKIINHNNLNS